MNKEIETLNKKADIHMQLLHAVQEEINLVIVGQEVIVNKLLIALLAKGHALLEGVPGLAKTLLVHSLAQVVSSGFARIQFTPDLLPADLTGTKIYNHKTANFTTVKGPLFTNFILADEINRAPPKVQSALLEAMQEKQITIHGETLSLKQPFMVLATQNPVENEGTYNLPEAQVDRFMFKLIIAYPTKEEEVVIMQRFTEGKSYKLKALLTEKKILELQKFVESIYVDEKIMTYVSELVDATRNPQAYNLSFDKYVDFGASPRASLNLILGAKAHALLQGRGYVIPEDVHAIAYDVLRHRILLSYEAQAEQKTSEDFIKQLLEVISVP